MAKDLVKEKNNFWLDVWSRLKKNRMALAGLGLVVLFIVLALAAPLLTSYDPTSKSLAEKFVPPSAKHLMGTDYLGRDVFARIIYGARISLLISIVAVSISLFFGVIIGSVAGYYGRWLDSVLMRTMDLMLAFPGILLAIAIVAIIGPNMLNIVNSLPSVLKVVAQWFINIVGVNLLNAIIAIGIVGVPIYARIVRSSVITVKEKEYIESAKAQGASDFRIITRHVLPNCLAPLIVQTTLGFAGAILEAAGLSYLGLGAKPPVPEWGSMLSDIINNCTFTDYPWTVIFPGVAIMSLVMGFNLLGDGLRDALDPRLK